MIATVKTESTDRFDLTEGDIVKKLLRLSLPTVGSQLTQMAYSFADMFWLGRLSSRAVAVSGAVAIFMWLSMAPQAFGGKGAEIGVSQNLGRRDYGAARDFIRGSLFVAAILGVAVWMAYTLSAPYMIGFLHIRETQVAESAVRYLRISAIAMPFNYLHYSAVSAFNASGNSAVPFYCNMIFLVVNAAIDPLFINTIGGGMGAEGAAAATVLCQIVSCVTILILLKRSGHGEIRGMRLTGVPRREYLRAIARWGSPAALEGFCFTFFIILVSRVVASFGSEALAVQRIGNQADQFSYFIAAGYGAALTAFIGQNYGAGRFDRIRRAFRLSTAVMALWGVGATAFCFFGGRLFFRLFVPGETAVIEMGARYLRVFAACQVAACLEGVGSSVFRGQGRTLFPSVVGVATHVLRVVFAWRLSAMSLGADGIWIALMGSAFLRGAGIYLAGLRALRGQPEPEPERGAGY
ncbi:MAG: MATE family efflux transporter [Oscillospiraceae bacterium]|nr:MATE family efflux transporter [Oscillospiraceae bacterium]